MFQDKSKSSIVVLEHDPSDPNQTIEWDEWTNSDESSTISVLQSEAVRFGSVNC